jgi:2-octaprenyl-6-methoxyphenol hydroxylase
MSITTDIIVAGTGPAGLISALALARAGFGVTLVGPAIAVEDRRTTALMKPSLDALSRLGIDTALEAGAAPLRVMRIVDATSRLIRSPTVTFHASEIGEPAFGLNIPNAHLLAILLDAVVAAPGIERVESLVDTWIPGSDAVEARLADGRVLAARLAVAADGRNSPARRAAGIEVSSRETGQAALVLTFGHARPHHDISTEFHTEHGPFTQVPLPGNRSSLVWVTTPRHAADLSAMAEVDLARAVEAGMQSMLGRVTLEQAPQIYPLATGMPQRFAANRIALVGEAAHVFPPIGAQGLNLGIRDAEALAAMATAHASDPGAPTALAAYDRSRRPDILARSTAVTLLNRSLLSDLLPAQLARSMGLGLLGRFAPLRTLFMREGLRTGSGFASLRR